MRVEGEITREPQGSCANCKQPFRLHQRIAVTVSGTDVLGGVVSRMQHVPACPVEHVEIDTHGYVRMRPQPGYAKPYIHANEEHT